MLCPEAFTPLDCKGVEVLGNHCSLLLASPIICQISASEIKLSPASGATSNNWPFLCVLLSPHQNLPPPSFQLPLSSISPAFLSLHSPLFLLPIYSFAALLPNSATFRASPRLCSPGPAMTVSFTRVSPVSSLSLRQPPAPTTRTRAQPQHRPTEGRHDHFCVGRRSARPFPGKDSD